MNTTLKSIKEIKEDINKLNDCIEKPVSVMVERLTELSTLTCFREE